MGGVTSGVRERMARDSSEGWSCMSQMTLRTAAFGTSNRHQQPAQLCPWGGGEGARSTAAKASRHFRSPGWEQIPDSLWHIFPFFPCTPLMGTAAYTTTYTKALHIFVSRVSHKMRGSVARQGGVNAEQECCGNKQWRSETGRERYVSLHMTKISLRC